MSKKNSVYSINIYYYKTFGVVTVAGVKKSEN